MYYYSDDLAVERVTGLMVFFLGAAVVFAITTTAGISPYLTVKVLSGALLAFIWTAIMAEGGPKNVKSYQGYNAGHTDEEIRRAFERKYGQPPEEIIRGKRDGGDLAGPLPDVVGKTRKRRHG